MTVENHHMSEWLGEGVIAEVRRVLAEPTTDPAYLHALCTELDNRVLRADLMIGILPMEALEVMAQGFAAAGTMGHRDSWVRLGRSYLGDRADTPVPWPSTYPFDDPDDEPTGAALRCFAEAARAGDRAAAYLFAATSRDASEPAQRYALTFLTPLLDDDPTGETHYWYGILTHFLGDAASALASQHEAAGYGNADAMFELYVHYVRGLGVELNEATAQEWLLKAAELDHNRAMYNVAAGYATGNGFPLDPAAAVIWYERAADAGNARAAATAGIMHLTGEGVPVDEDRAERWFCYAEEEGFDVDGWLEQLDLVRRREGAVGSDL